MKLHLNLTKNCLLAVFSVIFFLATGCKKDKLIVDQTKEYQEVGHKAQGPYDGGWSLTLEPSGTANVLPGGDIVYRGSYKINGSKIKVKTEQNSGSYVFEVISDTEIKEKESGTLLKLKQ